MKRSTSDFVNERSRQTQEEFEARMFQIRSQTSSCSPSQSLEDPPAPLRVSADVVGGKKKGRYTVLATLPATTRKGPAASTSESRPVAVLPLVALPRMSRR